MSKKKLLLIGGAYLVVAYFYNQNTTGKYFLPLDVIGAVTGNNPLGLFTISRPS